jgi:hypothetical protein
MHTDRDFRTTLDGTSMPHVPSYVSAGLMMTMQMVGPPMMRTLSMMCVPGRAQLLSRVSFSTVWYAICQLFLLL